MKDYVPRISKMWYFLGLAVFKVELLTAEVESNFKKKKSRRRGVQKNKHGHNFWNFHESSRQIKEKYIFLDLTRGFVKIPKIVAVFIFLDTS